MTDADLPGKLYVVATPLGNLEDITFRAVNILKKADLIAAEDTRHSKRLLSHFDIQAKLVSCHEHNENQKTPWLIERLQAGQSIALISDAGTPCISDPGYQLVNKAAEAGIEIIPIPGCSAAIAGLSVSGLPTDQFLFIGFLPKKKKKRELAVRELADTRATLIIYESPKRITALLKLLISILGDRNACLAREITKLHEEYIRGRFSHISTALEARASVKGECTLLIEGNTRLPVMDDAGLKKILEERLSRSDMPTKTLARQVADEFNLSRKKVYDAILKLTSGD